MLLIERLAIRIASFDRHTSLPVNLNV